MSQSGSSLAFSLKYLNRSVQLLEDVMKANMNLKFALLVVFVVVSGSLIPMPAHASEMKSCRVVTSDVGTITGHSKGGVSAFEDAATQCFDRHDALSLKTRGHLLDEDAGVTVIDQCANIKCS